MKEISLIIVDGIMYTLGFLAGYYYYKNNHRE